MSMPLRYRWQNWISTWVDLVVDLLKVLSFGYIDQTWWSGSIRVIWHKKNFAFRVMSMRDDGEDGK